MLPLISVIIPVYNAEKYIKETVLSVLRQSYTNFELLLINHASTDNSFDIMKEFQLSDQRIKIINLEINKGGPAYARNEGLKIALGQYIAFLDADDVWLDEKLEEQLNYIIKTKADIVHTLANLIDANSMIVGTLSNQRIYKILKFFFSNKSIIYCTNYININSVLMKNNQKIKFDEDKSLVAIEDWKYWIEHISNGANVVLLKKKLLNYRVHNLSTSSRNSDLTYRKILYMFSLLLLNKKIPVMPYIFSSCFNITKLIIQNIVLWAK